MNDSLGSLCLCPNSVQPIAAVLELVSHAGSSSPEMSFSGNNNWAKLSLQSFVMDIIVTPGYLKQVYTDGLRSKSRQRHDCWPNNASRDLKAIPGETHGCTPSASTPIFCDSNSLEIWSEQIALTARQPNFAACSSIQIIGSRLRGQSGAKACSVNSHGEQ